MKSRLSEQLPPPQTRPLTSSHHQQTHFQRRFFWSEIFLPKITWIGFSFEVVLEEIGHTPHHDAPAIINHSSVHTPRQNGNNQRDNIHRSLSNACRYLVFPWLYGKARVTIQVKEIAKVVTAACRCEFLFSSGCLLKKHNKMLVCWEHDIFRATLFQHQILLKTAHQMTKKLSIFQ